MSTPPPNWQPLVGPQATGMIDRSGLPEAARKQILEDAVRVLGRCINPDSWDREEASAELVVGEVQSGKTRSFTALTALAHDNKFPLVIVLAGTKKNLMTQTLERLEHDLAMDGDGGLPTWLPLDMRNHRPKAEDTAQTIRAWRDNPTWHPATTVAVVLKNRANLDRARDFVAELVQSCGSFPALIIDDEGDQAGLNLLAKKQDESPTYRAIRRLREALPLHSYVLYTATPQALLLVSLTDTVSPRTVTMLSHGEGYVGGPELFARRRSTFAHTIMDVETALDADCLAPPASLQEALAVYLIALVISQMRKKPRPLSMLVHPSATKDLHSTYEQWVRAIIKDRITPALASGDDKLIEQIKASLLQPAYNELAATDGTTVNHATISLDDVVKVLPQYLADVQIRVINSEDGAEVDPREWKRHTGWILIGGAKLDRGFTVENLAVTYMPRGPGIKNADTIQQRGRFFGYRSDYSDLLRAWLNPDTIEVYRQYVEHEKQMQTDLRYYDKHQLPLKDWRRKFLIDPSMNPTRTQVINLGLDRVRLTTGWVLTQQCLYGDTIGPSAEGADALQHILHNQAHADTRDRRAAAERRNYRCTVPWNTLSPVLADWEAVPEERSRLEALLLAVDAEKSCPDAEVIFIDKLAERHRSPAGARSGNLPSTPTSPTEAERLKIGELFQGRSHQYLGDDAFRSVERITVHFHRVVPKAVGPYGGKAVYALAIFLPKAMGDFLQER